MLQKIKLIMLTLLILPVILLVNPVVASSSLPTIDQSAINKGLIAVNYDMKSDTKYMIRISKGMKNYDYQLIPNGKYPLQNGNGTYKVMLGELVTGKTYKAVASEEVNLNLTDPNIVYLQSIQMINWNQNTKAVIKARELVRNAKSDEAKVAGIYNYIVRNVTYDYHQAAVVQAGYIPNLDEVYVKGTGICYDYATLMAAMLRSVGIPTKLVMGFHKDDLDTYHAWNLVYLDGEWQTIDTTYDAIKVQAGYDTPIFKNAIEYIAAYKIY